MKKKQVSVTLDAEILQKIKLVAHSKRLSVSSYINFLLYEHIKEKQKPC